jgi:SagB-type dehydrogenase family enzyme
MSGEFAKKFHKKTDFSFEIGTLPSNSQYWPKEWKEIKHKSYPRFPRVDLSRDFLELKKFEDVLLGRHSTREYDLTKKITLQELSTLLHYSAGIRPTEKNEEQGFRRFYPSIGAPYSLEIYLLIQGVEGLECGIYHYNIKEHQLEILSAEKKRIARMLEGLYYPWSREAPVSIFTTAVWERNFTKYEDRGYRLVLLDAGHLGQNLALVATALGLNSCNSAGFHNQRIEEVLDIEKDDEDTLYLTLIGK